jgi:hypothetical protein
MCCNTKFHRNQSSSFRAERQKRTETKSPVFAHFTDLCERKTAEKLIRASRQYLYLSAAQYIKCAGNSVIHIRYLPY